MLERQNIMFPLAQGVDTKTDPKQVVAGKLLELENGIFTTLKSIRKRNGTVALGKTITNSGTKITNGSALATYGNELLLMDGSDLYSYDAGADGWTDKGAFVSAYVEKASVVRDTYSQAQQDGVTAPNGLQLYAWEDSQNSQSVRYAITDTVTGQVIVASASLQTNAIKPRVLCASNVFLIYYYSIADLALRVAAIPAATPNASPIITTLTGVGGTDGMDTTSPNYDACLLPQSNNIVVAFNNANSATVGVNGETTVRRYAGAAPTTMNATEIVIFRRSRSICIFPVITDVGSSNSQGCVVAFYHDLNTPTYSGRLRFTAINANFTIVGVSSSSGLSGPNAATCLSGCASSDTNKGAYVWYADQTVSPPVTHLLTIQSDYITTTVSQWRRSVAPFARAFRYGGKAHVPVVYQSALQSTYFILDEDGSAIAKALPQTAGPIPTANTTSPFTSTSYVMPIVANVTDLGNGVFRIPVLEQAALAGTGIATNTGVSDITLTFDDPKHSFLYSELASALHFSGGFVQMYDGVDVVEHGFHLFPEGCTATPVGSGGSLSAGAYTYAVCYEWLDHQNQIHRSRPDEGIAQVTAVANDSVTLTIPYLQITDKVGDRPVQLVVYRTEANGTILHRVSSLTVPTVNVVNGGSANASYTDTMSDATLATMPLLYCQFLSQQPFEVENDPAPPTGIIQLHRNRLWVVDSTNPLTLWYSKDVFQAAPVEFNSGFTKRIDPRGGPITALASLDDKLLIFKTTHVFIDIGQGPLNTGQNNDLSDAIIVTSDVGCIDARSIVTTPLGVMFKSQKGIYLIDRSLAVNYIGAAVEAYNPETINAAFLVANTNQVRFTLDSGKALVFDYFVQQWGTFTNQQAVDALVWNQRPVMLRSNGSALRETDGVFTDAGSPIQLKIVTSWLTFANVLGFQRVRRAQVLGGWKSAHNLLIDVCVDFDDTVIQSVTAQPTTPSTYGSVSPYGAGSYGGEFQLYQWRIDLARQKTQAVKFTIRDAPATAGEGCSLSSIGFEVGAKVGLAKVPTSRTLG
jgi:hypothetical protein